MKWRQRGMALIVVLTTLAILISLAANYVLTVSRDTDSIYMLNSRIQARYSALSGVQYALFAMQDRDKNIRWTTDGRLYSVELAGGKVFARIVPESGRFDINTMRPPMMTLLFQYAGVEEAEAIQLMNNVMHWRDGNDVMIGNSVTDSDYDSAGLPIPPHRRFFSIEEFPQVFGVTPQIYQKIKSLITVYGSNKINGLVASDTVLAALALTEEQIAQIHTAREAYYADETPISSEVRSLSPHLSFNAQAAYYRVMAYGQTATGQVEAVYSIIKNQRSRDGSFREMERGTVSGKQRQAFIESIKNAQQSTEEG